MDRDTITRLGKEAGLIGSDPKPWGHREAVERFADLVAKAERHRIYEMLIKMHTQEERHNYYMFIANIIKESA